MYGFDHFHVDTAGRDLENKNMEKSIDRAIYFPLSQLADGICVSNDYFLMFYLILALGIVVAFVGLT